ncbi:hypothetical protein PG994_000524 [Apiospora phragmitis]|uniref:Rhodopsin domain-containing protein n=1 Tax=Apiospora phragmitis TaxID=2905665 RepID=A0ABR1X6N0_9PEZI
MADIAKAIHLPMLDKVRDHLVAESIIIGISLLVLTFRIVARFQGIGVGADDYMTVAGFVWLLLEIFVGTIFYIVCLSVLKISVLCFYRRIFGNTRWMRIATWLMIGVAASWWLSLTVALVFNCVPVEKQWTPGMPEGHCYNAVDMYKGLCVTNIITDIVIMVLPMRLILSLQMRKLEKVVLICCFALGTAVCAISVLRIVHLSDLELQADVTGSMEETVFLGVLELNIALISISLPSLRPFYTRWRAGHRAGSSKLSETGGASDGGLATFGGGGGSSKRYSQQKKPGAAVVDEWELDKYRGPRLGSIPTIWPTAGTMIPGRRGS